MCANPRDVCANFISLFRCSRSITLEEDRLSYFDALPVEILEKILLFLDYEQISKLRSLNRTLNSICSRLLNEAYFKIKEEVESCIFLSYDDLRVDGKCISEVVQEEYRNNADVDLRVFKPTLLKILFLNKILVILIFTCDAIFRFLCYRNLKSCGEDFVFIYGNCVDWAIEKLKHVQHNHVDEEATACLVPPPEVTSHSSELIAFYKKKSRSSTSDFEKCMKMNREIYYLANYERHVQPIAREVEVMFYASIWHNMWRQGRKTHITRDYLNDESWLTDLTDILPRITFFATFHYYRYYWSVLNSMSESLMDMEHETLRLFNF